MTASRKLFVSTIVGSILTGLYWIGFFYIAYGMTAGDTRPGTEASGARGTVTALFVWVGGFAVYMLLAWGWRRIDFRLARQDG